MTVGAANLALANLFGDDRPWAVPCYHLRYTRHFLSAHMVEVKDDDVSLSAVYTRMFSQVEANCALVILVGLHLGFAHVVELPFVVLLVPFPQVDRVAPFTVARQPILVVLVLVELGDILLGLTAAAGLHVPFISQLSA